MPPQFALAIPLLAAAVAANAYAQRSPTEAVPDTIEARVQACIGCHGAQGQGVENVYFPRLAGKPAGYLYNQLVAFRDGRRKYVPMNYLLAYLPDAYLSKMASYFAALNPPYPGGAGAGDKAPPPALVEEGRRIASEGVQAARVPPCMACHGTALNGREPGIPGLLGLRADYVSAQLGAWRYGVRTALAQDCMQFVAASLTEHQVEAVSAFLAAQPVPPNLRPAPADQKALPLECGSQQGRAK